MPPQQCLSAQLDIENWHSSSVYFEFSPNICIKAPKSKSYFSATIILHQTSLPTERAFNWSNLSKCIPLFLLLRWPVRTGETSYLCYDL